MNVKLQEALNDQINHELVSAYAYLAMQAYFESRGMHGSAQWMKMQSNEEVEHAMKLYDYILRRNGKVVLAEIGRPRQEWKSHLEVFEDALKHEKKVTELINNLMSEAVSERDYATISFLQWFVDEQVEEEENVTAVLDKLRLIGDDRSGLYLLDRDLGSRKE